MKAGKVIAGVSVKAAFKRKHSRNRALAKSSYSGFHIINSHRGQREHRGGHYFSVFCGALRWLTIFIHLKTGIVASSEEKFGG
jgi:hypothetical protein